ncbi:MAG: PP2C family protein-serine/threonine phosphatase [Ilumatobacteraceae bacterium]
MPSDGVIRRLLEAADRVSPANVFTLVDHVCEALGADSGRLLVADYALRCLQHVDAGGAVGGPHQMAGTVPGRVFASGQIVVSESSPTVVTVPLLDGSDRIGVLELTYGVWDGRLPVHLDSILNAFVMALVVKVRYSDVWACARRSEAMSLPAEVQWALLPPLSCSTDQVSVGGILEPAYSIGGDSFDYALNGGRLEFAIVDAIGRGMGAVLMSSAVINSLRNSRRAGTDLDGAYRNADRVVATQFGDFNYVTGQMGSIDLQTGHLTWVNAGHVPPILVRNNSYAGRLLCSPSMPLGLGGPVVQVATESLQRGDRVLFYSDGITESRSPSNEFFGEDRLADFLVRASLEQVSVSETARRLSRSLIEYVSADLKDDATLLLIEYRGTPTV